MIDIVRLADHHRTGVFSSGTALLDDFLRNEAYFESGDYGTTWVVVSEAGSPEVIAFYTLLYPYELSDSDDASLALPAVELLCLAVDKAHQGTGVGTKILRGLIDRILEVQDEYAINLLLLVAISSRVRAWYFSRGLGFHTADAPQDRMTLYLPVVEMRGLRESDPDWDEKRYTLPTFTWPLSFVEEEDNSETL